MSARVDGADQVAEAIMKWGKGKREAAAFALQVEAHGIKNESMKRTPVDTGVLRLSHVVSAVVYTLDSLLITIGVGGPAVGYAIYVHENLQARHTVGRAKFLESALLEKLQGFAGRIAATMRSRG